MTNILLTTQVLPDKEFIETLDGVKPEIAVLVIAVFIILVMFVLFKLLKKSDDKVQMQYIGIIKDVIADNNKSLVNQMQASNDRIKETMENYTSTVAKLVDSIHEDRAYQIQNKSAMNHMAENLSKMASTLAEHEGRSGENRIAIVAAMDRQNDKLDRLYYDFAKCDVPKFGDIACKKGYITEEERQDVINTQKQIRISHLESDNL